MSVLNKLSLAKERTYVPMRSSVAKALSVTLEGQKVGTM